MTATELEELTDPVTEIPCEHLPLCGRAADLLLLLLCGCDRFACLPCRNRHAKLGFCNQVCRTCGMELDGPWEKIIIREVTL